MEKTYFLNREQYLNLKAAWKNLSDSKQITPGDVVIYNVLRGKPIANGFSKTTNPNHIQRNNEWNGFVQAKEAALNNLPECSSSTYWLRTARKITEDTKAHYERANEKLRINFERKFGIEIPPNSWLSKNIKDADHTDPHYVYLFVREDLSIPQQIVQVAHAVEQISQG